MNDKIIDADTQNIIIGGTIVAVVAVIAFSSFDNWKMRRNTKRLQQTNADFVNTMFQGFCDETLAVLYGNQFK